MPFRRNRRVRRSRVVRRRRRGRGRMVRRRRVALDPERKSSTLTIIGQTINSAGAIFHINIAEEGLGPGNRIGRQALWVSAQSQMNFTIGAAATIPSVIKVWLILDKQPQTNVITLDDFLNQPAAATVSSRNLDNINRFKVMWTAKFHLQVFIPSVEKKFFKSFRFKSRYNAAGGMIAQMENGALYVIMVSDTPLANLPMVDFQTRCRFVG